MDDLQAIKKQLHNHGSLSFPLIMEFCQKFKQQGKKRIINTLKFRIICFFNCILNRYSNSSYFIFRIIT